LGKESFSECRSLESVTFENCSRLERIGEYSFFHSGLRSIEIPSSVVVLGTLSFRECRSLESVTFENGARLERIDESAFRKSGLKSIVIPSSVAFVSDCAFLTDSECSILVSQDNRHFRTRESFLEDICGSKIYRYFRSCFSIVIPSSVVVLCKWSFAQC
jgi:hypothetical protein